MLFHVILQAIFCRIEEGGQTSAARALQRQYFTLVSADYAERLWDAPWKSGPDRIMPGTDAGSAPQQSWHRHVLKPAFAGAHAKDPWTVAQVQQDSIVSPLQRRLRGMQEEGRQFQDRPGVGQFLDPSLLEGRRSAGKTGQNPWSVLAALEAAQPLG